MSKPLSSSKKIEFALDNVSEPQSNSPHSRIFPNLPDSCDVPSAPPAPLPMTPRARIDDPFIIPQLSDERKREKDIILADGLTDLDYVSYPAKNINVILVGKTRAGKTTLKDMLATERPLNLGGEYGHDVYLGHLKPLAKRSIDDRGTLEPQVHAISMHHRRNGKREYFNLNLIDSPGLCEVKGHGPQVDKGRKDTELVKLLQNLVKRELKKIHLIIFVVDSTQNDQSLLDAIITLRSSLQSIQKYGIEYSGKQCLLMTHMENSSADEIDDLTTSRIKLFKNTLTIQASDVLCAGCITQVDYENFGDDNLRQLVQRVNSHRRKFFDYLLEIANEEKKGSQNSSCPIL